MKRKSLEDYDSELEPEEHETEDGVLVQNCGGCGGVFHQDEDGCPGCGWRP